MTYSDPKFPIVNPSPSVDDCVGAFRFRDYAVASGLTAASWGYGYILGKPHRFPTANTAAALGLTAAGMIILQDSRGRLMGYKENEREVKKYGAWAEQIAVRDTGSKRFPTAVNGYNPIKGPPEYKNYN